MAGRKAEKIPEIDMDGADFKELEIESRRLAAWRDDQRISPDQLASLLRMSPRKLLDLRRAGAG
ncbi:hypothetical protein, partial [Halovibrio sp. HP20-50]|uniref:hypothetical protein n=1 Tax=Halovibrio sp. HP20-59 TaxID=3080275 RepID=UPI00294B84D9